jgi:hypothetical protein
LQIGTRPKSQLNVEGVGRNDGIHQNDAGSVIRNESVHRVVVTENTRLIHERERRAGQDPHPVSAVIVRVDRAEAHLTVFVGVLNTVITESC